jgi:hypothetical protein
MSASLLPFRLRLSYCGTSKSVAIAHDNDEGGAPDRTIGVYSHDHAAAKDWRREQPGFVERRRVLELRIGSAGGFCSLESLGPAMVLRSTTLSVTTLLPWSKTWEAGGGTRQSRHCSAALEARRRQAVTVAVIGERRTLQEAQVQSTLGAALVALAAKHLLH